MKNGKLATPYTNLQEKMQANVNSTTKLDFQSFPKTGIKSRASFSLFLKITKQIDLEFANHKT